MFGAVKRNLSGLQRSQPGQRFQNKYRSAHRKGVRTSTFGRVLRIAVAVVSFVVGVVLSFMPGPGVVFFALAGALLAPESLWLARGLDWTELKIRAGFGWAKRTWAKLGWWARSVVILVAALVTATASWVAWQFFFG